MENSSDQHTKLRSMKEDSNEELEATFKEIMMLSRSAIFENFASLPQDFTEPLIPDLSDTDVALLHEENELLAAGYPLVARRTQLYGDVVYNNPFNFTTN